MNGSSLDVMGVRPKIGGGKVIIFYVYKNIRTYSDSFLKSLIVLNKLFFITLGCAMTTMYTLIVRCKCRQAECIPSSLTPLMNLYKSTSCGYGTGKYPGKSL